jgi:hypothetical protein
MKPVDWLLISLCAAVFCGVAFNTKKAHSHDPLTHQANELAEAKSEAYGKCCDGSDFAYVRVQDWETTDTGYRVRIGNRWLEAPRSVKVRNVPNIDGEAKVWVYGSGDTMYIRCFLEGALS